MSGLETLVMEAILDGQESGIELAIDALRSMKVAVAAENQTWDSAIALLEIFLSEAVKARATGEDRSEKGAA